MDKSEFQKLKEAWDLIDQIENIEQMAQNSSFAFYTGYVHTCGSMLDGYHPLSTPLPSPLQQIIMEALVNYKTELLSRMDALEVNDKMAMPIE